MVKLVLISSLLQERSQWVKKKVCSDRDINSPTKHKVKQPSKPREGLKDLLEEVRQRLVRHCRAKHICKFSKEKQKELTRFSKDSFRYARHLEEKESGKLKASREQME